MKNRVSYDKNVFTFQEMMTKTTQFLAMAPEFIEQAIKYVKANPEEAFWSGVKFSKMMLKQIVAEIKSAKSQDVEKAVFDFYTKVRERPQNSTNL